MNVVDDEVVEIDPPIAKSSSSKKVSSKASKASAKEKAVRDGDDEEEVVEIRKPKGPARKAAVAPKQSPQKATSKAVPPSSGMFDHHFISSFRIPH